LLAQKYGFQGKFGPRLPASGGMNLRLSRSQNPSRTRIAVKGYQNQWGQALVALKCIEDLAGDLQDFEITLFSCNRVTLKAAKRLATKTGLRVTAFGKGALKNEQVHELLSESIALVSLSKSDGVPASMLEAMANGAVPIQSDTSAADEWLDQGKGGFLVKWDDVKTIKEKLTYIVNNPEFRESAAKANYEKLKSSIDSEMTLDVALQTYEMLTPAKR
jgi:glycosyltransferase involved in cell wall biosynthesis